MFTPDPGYVPFCGAPPLPAELLSRWTFEPALLIGLALALAAGLGAAPAGRPRGAFLAGWGLTALLFVSPICALSMALFSARVGQHLLLTLAAAPLMALAFRPLPVSPMSAAVAFSALFWFWHLPAPYQATLEGDLVYWAMHLTLLGSAMVFWSTLIARFHAMPMQGFLSAILVGGQMSLLSALLIFSRQAWHPWHEAGAVPYGLTAMADQALAGGLMWVFGAAVFIGAVGVLVARVAITGCAADAPQSARSRGVR